MDIDVKSLHNENFDIITDIKNDSGSYEKVKLNPSTISDMVDMKNGLNLSEFINLITSEVIRDDFSNITKITKKRAEDGSIAVVSEMTSTKNDHVYDKRTVTYFNKEGKEIKKERFKISYNEETEFIGEEKLPDEEVV